MELLEKSVTLASLLPPGNNSFGACSVKNYIQNMSVYVNWIVVSSQINTQDQCSQYSQAQFFVMHIFLMKSDLLCIYTPG